MFNIPGDPREEHNVIDDYSEEAEKLKAELRNWYEEILESSSSYTHPRFLIGKEGNEETFLYACGSCRIC